MKEARTFCAAALRIRDGRMVNPSIGDARDCTDFCTSCVRKECGIKGPRPSGWGVRTDIIRVDGPGNSPTRRSDVRCSGHATLSRTLVVDGQDVRCGRSWVNPGNTYVPILNDQDISWPPFVSLERTTRGVVMLPSWEQNRA